MRIKIATTLLWVLIGFGFLGGLNVSYANYTGEQACPNVSGLAICYVVTLAYGLMLLSLLIQKAAYQLALFLSAWGITFYIALFGTSLELMSGDVCPKTSGLLPLCFVSLALCLVLVLLFMLSQSGKNSRAPIDL
jgi:hypothetical protein